MSIEKVQVEVFALRQVKAIIGGACQRYFIVPHFQQGFHHPT
jgi:hypothetical protein